jgi:hypothetical protein
VNVAHLVAEPDVEGILQGAQSRECRLEVIGFDVHDGKVAGWSRLDPDGLSGDAVSRPRGLVGGLTLAAGCTRPDVIAILLAFSGRQRCSKGHARHAISFGQPSAGARGRGRSRG